MNSLKRSERCLQAGNATVLLAARGLCKSFGNTVAVRSVSFDVPERTFVTLLGPSGCGKTTILRMIAGFETVTAGSLRLNGVPIELAPPELRPVNTVFQTYALFPHLTVEDNVGFSLRLRKVPKSETLQQIRRALDTVHMTDFAARYPNELSGGQQQRVAVARAIIAEPKLLLLDEPLSALDRKMREHLQVELKDIQRRLGISFIYVTHDQEEAFALSDLVVVMNAGEIVQIGAPEQIYAEPANRFVAEFIGSSALFPGRIVSVSAKEAIIKTGLGLICAPAAPGFMSSQAALLTVRPEALVRDDAGDLECRVVRNVFQGGRTLTQLDCAGAELGTWSDTPLTVGARHKFRLIKRKTWITKPA